MVSIGYNFLLNTVATVASTNMGMQFLYDHHSKYIYH